MTLDVDENQPQPQAVGDGCWGIRNRTFPSNTYIFKLSSTNDCVIIDPGLDQDGLRHALSVLSMKPVAVFCTHGHFDHIGCASWVQELYGVKVYLHQNDAKEANSANFAMMLARIDSRIKLPEFTLVTDGFAWRRGTDLMRYSHTPGHTSGSCCLFLGSSLFSGDTLYSRSVDSARSAGRDDVVLRQSLRRLALSVPPNFTLCPGHGRADSFNDVLKCNSDLKNILAEDPAVEPCL
jgi:glyoxylase-like metal-dependent hydrolase (beta-lactamase superfamily II)